MGWRQQAGGRGGGAAAAGVGISDGAIGAVYWQYRSTMSTPAARQRPFDAGLVVASKVLRHQRAGEPRGACNAFADVREAC